MSDTKNLKDMTHDELFACDENEVSELLFVHDILLPRNLRTLDNYLECLEERRLELRPEEESINE